MDTFSQLLEKIGLHFTPTYGHTACHVCAVPLPLGLQDERPLLQQEVHILNHYFAASFSLSSLSLAFDGMEEGGARSLSRKK